jgi:biotin transport system substrate-specific component
MARDIALVVGTAAFVGLSAQVAIPLPFTPVPLSLQTFAVLLAAAALGPAISSRRSGVMKSCF